MLAYVPRLLAMTLRKVIHPDPCAPSTRTRNAGVPAEIIRIRPKRSQCGRRTWERYSEEVVILSVSSGENWTERVLQEDERESDEFSDCIGNVGLNGPT